MHPKNSHNNKPVSLCAKKGLGVNASEQAVDLNVAQILPDSMTPLARVTELGCLLVRGLYRSKLAEFGASGASVPDSAVDAKDHLTSSIELSDSCAELNKEDTHD